jgi:hypothetical protein
VKPFISIGLLFGLALGGCADGDPAGGGAGPAPDAEDEGVPPSDGGEVQPSSFGTLPGPGPGPGPGNIDPAHLCQKIWVCSPPTCPDCTFQCKEWCISDGLGCRCA